MTIVFLHVNRGCLEREFEMKVFYYMVNQLKKSDDDKKLNYNLK